jgi:hypothetical protein
MGNSALGRGTAVEENKVKASSGDGAPDFLDGKVDGTTMTVVGDQLVRAALTGGVTTVGNAATVVTNANLTGVVTSTGNATAIADKALAISKLADGTDGELITWDAAGVISTVPAGTATQVLTSNGAGAAPTFQAASGGGSLTLIDTNTVVGSNTGDIALAVDNEYIVNFQILRSGGSSSGRNVFLRFNSNAGADYAWSRNGLEFNGSPLGVLEGDASGGEIIIYQGQGTSTQELQGTMFISTYNNGSRDATVSAQYTAFSDADFAGDGAWLLQGYMDNNTPVTSYEVLDGGGLELTFSIRTYRIEKT